MNAHKTLVCIVSALLVFITPATLQADMVDTPTMLSSEQNYARSERVRQEAQVGSFMAREEVLSQLESLGVSQELAAERVGAMTDAQLQQLALRIDEMPAGGDGLGVVVTVLVILLLLEILGVTDIFNKV